MADARFNQVRHDVRILECLGSAVGLFGEKGDEKFNKHKQELLKELTNAGYGYRYESPDND